MIKAILEELPDSWGIGNGCLVALDFFYDRDTDERVELTDEELEAKMRPYLGTEVIIMNDENVYSRDGEYLGTYYS